MHVNMSGFSDFEEFMELLVRFLATRGDTRITQIEVGAIQALVTYAYNLTAAAIANDASMNHGVRPTLRYIRASMCVRDGR